MARSHSPRSARFRGLTATLILALWCSACQVHTHRVGGGPTGIGEESARQYYWMFGLLQLNEVNVQRMAADLGSYEIRSEITFWDFLLTPLLLPFTITTRTVTVKR
jgi:hypothetical protein